MVNAAQKHVIDIGSIPAQWEGLTVETHQKGGSLLWGVHEIGLYQCKEQIEGHPRHAGMTWINGNELLREKFGTRKMLNACVADYLEAHPELIPDAWIGKKVHFWGTIYTAASSQGSWDDRQCTRFILLESRETKPWSSHQDVLDGYGEDDYAAVLLLSEDVVDLDAAPELRPWMDGWEVVEHRKGGRLVWDPERLGLYRSAKQQDDGEISWEELRKELENQPIMNANVLEHLLEHRELIPEAWKELDVPFWGTIYRNDDGFLCVQSIWWDECAHDGLDDAERASDEYKYIGWTWGMCEIDETFGRFAPAAILLP